MDRFEKFNDHSFNDIEADTEKTGYNIVNMNLSNNSQLGRDCNSLLICSRFSNY